MISYSTVYGKINLIVLVRPIVSYCLRFNVKNNLNILFFLNLLICLWRTKPRQNSNF